MTLHRSTLRRPTLRRSTRLLTVVAVTAAGLTAAVPARAASYCGLVWGSTPKAAAASTTAQLVGVRAGQQPCYDRLVLDLRSRVTGFDVRYVPQITRDGSGTVVPTRGGAALQVVVQAPAYDDAGHATYAPADPAELAPVSSFRTFRQVVWAQSFEGQSTVGVGVRARLPFRAFVLTGPGDGSRLVVDVAHRW